MQYALTQVYWAIEDEHEADMRSQRLKLDICKKCLETKDTSLDLKLWCVTELSELVKLRVEQSFENQGQASITAAMADQRKKKLT